MDVPSLEPYSDAQIDRYPLLMERMEAYDDHEHAININDASLSSSQDDQLPRVESLQDRNQPSGSIQAAAHQAPLSMSNRINSRNSSFLRRGDRYSLRRRSPLNSRLWISVELIVTVSQIVAPVVVLSLSRHEKPQAPLFAWVVGYASGCVAILPFLYLRYNNCMQGAEQDSNQSHTGSSQSNPSSEPYRAVSATQTSEEDNNLSRGTGSMNNQGA